MASLWNLEGVPPRVILKNTWNSIFSDNLLGRSAELGFYFLFALFPMLFSACSILGMAARTAPKIYNSLLLYLAIVVPSTALGTVLQTFNQTTAAASSDKLTFGLAAAIWSASVGFSAIQDSLNVVYRVKETRPYLKARLSAIGVTIILSVLMTVILATLLRRGFPCSSRATKDKQSEPRRLDRNCLQGCFMGCGYYVAITTFCPHLLFWPGRGSMSLALAFSRSGCRHYRLAARITGIAALRSPFFQHIFGNLRITWSGHYSLNLVLLKRADALAWR